ncbi:MAG: YabP/YqfC family sporulation protein [Clostridia bacterium]|nr:YabP/YqfC family sporulation protein [Clostridia bacterium]
MRNFRKRLAKAMELPVTSFGGCSYLTIESNVSIKIDGCEEILSYEENEVSLRLSDGYVTITGEGMTIRSYAMRTVRIVGTVRSVSLTEKEPIWERKE